MIDIIEREGTTLLKMYLSLSNYNGAIGYINEVLKEQTREGQTYLVFLDAFRKNRIDIACSLLTGQYRIDISIWIEDLRRDVNVPLTQWWELKKAVDRQNSHHSLKEVKESLLALMVYFNSKDLKLSNNLKNDIFKETPLHPGSMILKVNYFRFFGMEEELFQLIERHSKSIVEMISSYPNPQDPNLNVPFYTQYDEHHFLMPTDYLRMKNELVQAFLSEDLEQFATQCAHSINSKKIRSDATYKIIEYQVVNDLLEKAVINCEYLNTKSSRDRALSLIFSTELNIDAFQRLCQATYKLSDQGLKLEIKDHITDKYLKTRSQEFNHAFHSLSNLKVVNSTFLNESIAHSEVDIPSDLEEINSVLETDLYNDEINLSAFGHNDSPEI